MYFINCSLLSLLSRVEYLALEDLTWGRQWPCIMDVKMGTRSYEDNASAEKIAYEKTKFPLQETVGFRIQGIKVFDPKQRSYVEFDKYFGRGITSVDKLAPAFRCYFPSEDTTKTIKLLEAVSLLRCLFVDDKFAGRTDALLTICCAFLRFAGWISVLAASRPIEDVV